VRSLFEFRVAADRTPVFLICLSAPRHNNSPIVRLVAEQVWAIVFAVIRLIINGPTSEFLEQFVSKVVEFTVCLFFVKNW
jgi:hypothetical protein